MSGRAKELAPRLPATAGSRLLFAEMWMVIFIRRSRRTWPLPRQASNPPYRLRERARASASALAARRHWTRRSRARRSGHESAQALGGADTGEIADDVDLPTPP